MLNSKIKSCLFAAMLLLTTSAFADEAATLKAGIQASMNKYTAAWKKKDSKATEAILRANFAKDFVSTMGAGQKLTLEQWIAQDKMQMSAIKTVKSMSIKIGAVKIKGNKASSDETFSAEFVIASPQGNGKTSVMSIKGASKSTYKKVGGKWLVATMTETSSKMMMDGKPFNPGGG